MSFASSRYSEKKHTQAIYLVEDHMLTISLEYEAETRTIHTYSILQSLTPAGHSLPPDGQILRSRCREVFVRRKAWGAPGAANFYLLRLHIGAVQEGNFQGGEKSGRGVNCRPRGELPSDAGSTAPT